uniref:BTB domain-containing protein n=1 Tax=Oryza glumipatula TaxID=40148 RepID=A0A0E0A1R1_9ORYZ
MTTQDYDNLKPNYSETELHNMSGISDPVPPPCPSTCLKNYADRSGGVAASSSRGKSWRSRGKDADVAFEVGGGGRERFAAHRCVLAARSKVFKAELFGAMKEGDAACVVRIDDMEPQVFRALLFFVYTDSLPEMRKEEEEAICQRLLVAAEVYGMERLKLICESKLCKYIDVGTVASIMALVDQYHCHGPWPHEGLLRFCQLSRQSNGGVSH